MTEAVILVGLCMSVLLTGLGVYTVGRMSVYLLDKLLR